MTAEVKTAIVTGSARGIGKAIAMRLAGTGYNVVVSDINEEASRQTAIEIEEKFDVKTLVVKADVSLADDADNLIKQTVDTFSSVDVLVNNAGVTRDNLAIRMSEKDWDMVLNINLKGTSLCSQAAAKVMMKKRSGSIVNISSVSGILGTAGQANYASSKAGVIALTKALARELGPRNITVNAIAPGFILTEMTEQLPDKVKEEYLKQIPLNRAGTPEDIAQVVGFLISPSASYITGTVIVVSGGMVM
ncbi:MAG TPA: 3-oxoacyl-[acyl-carrier-protein] reductase [Calditrichaeota bacterium]|nr:3-oxoacyl-[acyl-carrier-protein] reductase [Calditrichota bacterium]